MKDAFQKEHEGEDENDWTIGPGGKKVLTPEAAQRKVVKDRATSEEVSLLFPLPSLFNTRLTSQKARLRKARVDKLAENLRNRLAIFTEAARGPEDKAVVDSFKVSPPPSSMLKVMLINRLRCDWKQSESTHVIVKVS